MITNLDNIDSRESSGGNVTQLQTQVTALDTKVTNLSNITAKTNIANTFTANQTVNGVIVMTGTPTENNHVVTKQYVDNKVGNWVIMQNWTGNFKTTSLQWTNTFNAGEYEINVIVKNNNFRYPLTFFIKIEATADKFVSPVALFNYGTQPNVSNIVPSVANGYYMSYDGVKIYIYKVGNTQPEANTNVLIRYKKVG